VAIDAPLQTRYERAKKRNRPGDDIDLDVFKHKKTANALILPVHMNRQGHRMADQTIDNSGSISGLNEKLGEMLVELR